MPAIHVKTRVPENRQITLTLPPETPVGDVELEIVVLDPTPIKEFHVVLPDGGPKIFLPRPTNPILAAEHDAFERMLPELMAQYAGKYVVLRGGVVTAVGETEIDVLTAVHRQVPGTPVYARLVTDQPQPIPRIRTRLPQFPFSTRSPASDIVELSGEGL